MKKIDDRGAVAGFVTWIILEALWLLGFSCEGYGGCSDGEMLILVAVSAGILLPSWLVAISFTGSSTKKPSINPGFWARNGGLIGFYTVVILVIIQAFGNGELW